MEGEFVPAADARISMFDAGVGIPTSLTPSPAFGMAISSGSVTISIACSTVRREHGCVCHARGGCGRPAGHRRWRSHAGPAVPAARSAARVAGVGGPVAKARDVRFGDPRPAGGSLIGKFTESTGSARHIEGVIGTARPVPSLIDSGVFSAIVDVDAGSESRRLGDIELDEAPGALDIGAPGRDLGNAAIDVIAGELAARQRENGFAEFARSRLFPAADTTGHITAHADWVMFHRRRHQAVRRRAASNSGRGAAVPVVSRHARCGATGSGECHVDRRNVRNG